MPDHIRNRLSIMGKLIDQTAVAVQRLAGELRPPMLDELGLIAAVSWYIQDFEERSGIACTRIRIDDVPSADRTRATALYRVLQESLTNVARHSQATEVEIRLEFDGGSVLLEVKDNGKGITNEEMKNSIPSESWECRSVCRDLAEVWKSAEFQIRGPPCGQQCHGQRNTPMRVLIADDHQLIREGLRRALVGTSEITEVGEAETGQQAIDMVRHGSWDVLILDISLPGKSGFEVLTELRQIKPAVPVLVLSMHPALQFGVRALHAGAAGYLSKTASTEELLQAIRKVAGGGKYVSQEIAEQLAVRLDDNPDLPPHTLLSEREFQVFLLIGSGKTVGEIARELNLNVRTISTHRAHILEKMHLQNNAQIMQYAVVRGLLD